MLDMGDLSNSELAIELFAVTESGYDAKWAGIYYFGRGVYLDLSDTFNIPKMSMSDIGATDLINSIFDLLGLGKPFVAGSVNNGVSSGEALTAGSANDAVLGADGVVNFSQCKQLLRFRASGRRFGIQRLPRRYKRVSRRP